MFKKRKQVASEPKPPSHDQIRNDIRRDTEDFLKLGGVIQSIPNGVSGQVWKPKSQTK